jgi:hypothetical protein
MSLAEQCFAVTAMTGGLVLMGSLIWLATI